MNCDCNQGRLECSCASDLEGSAAQKAYWAGFEAATMRPAQSNIRAAWNDYRLTDEFKRISQPRCGVAPLERSENFTASNGEYRNPQYAGQHSDETADQAETRLRWVTAAIEVARINPPGECVAVPRDVAQRMALDAAQYDHEHAIVNDNVQLWQQPSARISLTVGDLRTVRALLAQQGKGIGDNE